MINEQIRDKEVRLIGADGAQLGIMSAKEAMFKAQEAGLDLVKIAPQASSRHVLDDFAELLKDIAVVEKAPKIEGRSMTMFLSEKR